MCTIWPAFIQQGHKELTRILHSSFTPLVSENHHEQVSSPFATPGHAPKHAASQAATLVGFFTNTPSTVRTRPVKRLRATPTNLNFLGPSQERWRSTEFRRTRVSRQQETQITNNNGTLLQLRWGIPGSTRISTAIDGKTTIEALQFLTTFGATPKQISVHRTVQGVDPRMSQSSFADSDCTGTTFKTNIRGPLGHLFGNTSNLQFTLTSFRQVLCDEILGPTFLCSGFTTSTSLGFLQTREPRVQEGFRVEASSTLFRGVLALVCATTTGHGVFPTLCSSAATYRKSCDRRKICTTAISCSRRATAQLHFDNVVTFEPEATEPPRSTPMRGSDTTSERAPLRAIFTDTDSSILWSVLSVRPRAEGDIFSHTDNEQALEVPLEHITLALLFDRTYEQDRDRALEKSSSHHHQDLSYNHLSHSPIWPLCELYGQL